ncbi:MAG: hypothetical protein K2I30_04940 [Clostridia bacterium]|nr:hypothetical protein [Clostridia bacterium]
MEENFLKFKKKVWLHILIKCIAAGLAAGLVAVNAVLLPCRLYAINLFWLYYVLIALGGFAIGGGVAFLFLRTDDKKIAKRLDSELHLSERVQTALEYGGQGGAMFEIQRADASSALGAKPKNALRFKNAVATALCAAVFLTGTVSIPVVATTVPAVFTSSEDVPPADPPRDITDWEWTALDELIDYVNSSKKADGYFKSGVVGHLQGLKTVLLNGVSQSSLSSFVQNTVTNIRNTVKDANERGISEEQQTLNSEEEAYVIAKLYEIFSLQQNGDGEDDPDKNPDEGDDPNGGGNSGVGPGDLIVNDTPFFDPELGFVKCGEVRSEYYARVQQALNEGVISREEWEYIMSTYFSDLNSNDD